MAEVQIASISHRHEAIADFLLAHPNVKNLQVLCEELRVSRPWLSVVMRSDVFREYFGRRRADWEKEMMGQIGMQAIRVMGKAWDKLEGILDNEDTDPRLVFDVAHKTAERLFGKTGPVRVVEEHTQEVVRQVGGDTLAQAREIFKRTVTKETQLEQLPSP